MSLRDKALTGLGIALTVLGITLTIFWSVESGLIALLLVGLLICLLFVLQRRQMARVQQRLLKLAELVRDCETAVADANQHQLVLHRKLLGHIQAQQISMELLNNKFDDVFENYRVR